MSHNGMASIKKITLFKDNIPQWPSLSDFNEAARRHKILSKNGKTTKKLMVC